MRGEKTLKINLRELGTAPLNTQSFSIPYVCCVINPKLIISIRHYKCGGETKSREGKMIHCLI